MTKDFSTALHPFLVSPNTIMLAIFVPDEHELKRRIRQWILIALYFWKK